MHEADQKWFWALDWPDEVVSADAAALIAKDREDMEIRAAADYEKKKIQARKKAEEQVKEEDLLQRKLLPRTLAGIRPSNQEWLWQDRIPIGEITMVAGKGGIGKSLFLYTLVSWITNGTAKGKYNGTPKPVIFIPNEDSFEKKVVPSMIAAGANMDLVYTLDVDHGGQPGRLRLPEDCDRLIEVIENTDAVAVILDPLSSNMSDRDRNSPEVRQSYERVRKCAEDAGIALIGNGHTRKGQSADMLEGLMGSSEIGNVIRALIGVANDPASEKPTVVLSQCKNNNGRMDLKSYTYEIVEYEFPFEAEMIKAPVLVWGESTERHVNDILVEPTHLDVKSDINEATDWLRDYLMQDPGSPRKTVIAEAMKAGLKEHTVKRAATRLKVAVSSTGFPRTTIWSLPVRTVGTDVPTSSD